METYDVVVVGGGAAGLSAAVVLGRSRRSVVVVDAGEPRNAPAEGVHGFLTRDGMPPSELVAIGRAEAESYGARIVAGEAVAVRGERGAFEVELADGGVLAARRVIVATGLVDELPDVPGVRERWGRTVIHCPYCHGWEHRDERIVVLATAANATHQALLFRQLSEDVVVLAHGAEPDGDEAAQLASMGVPVVEAKAERLVDGGIELADGSTLPADVVVVQSRMVARSALLAPLGIEPTPHPFGELVGAVVPGVWVAGNVTDLAAQVVVAAGQGVMAGAMANADLVAEAAAPR
jgi:thioredoxin reductase